MTLNLRRALAGAAALVVVACPATASAAPTTVSLRIEGASATLFDGPVTTDARTITAPSSGGARPCDFASNGDPKPGGDPQATPTSALYDAVNATGLAFDAQWFDFNNDLFVTRVGDDANGGPPNYPSWGLAVDGIPPNVGGCEIALRAGQEVVWAYDMFSKTRILKLSGPRNANVGETVQLVVRNAGNGVGVEGATVGGARTDANGVAHVTFQGVGVHGLKAEEPSSVRSNGISVCIHDGNDGNCGTVNEKGVAAPAAPAEPGPVTAPSETPPVVVAPRDTQAPVATVSGLADGARLRRGPRELKGTIADAGGVKAVKLRLTRKAGKRCFTFSGSRERFRAIPCDDDGWWFQIGDDAEWSYLLPARLPSGRYVLEVKAIDTAGNRGAVERRKFRVG